MPWPGTLRVAVREDVIDHRGAEIGLQIGQPVDVIWKPGYPQTFRRAIALPRLRGFWPSDGRLRGELERNG